ncbi:hypothetical protein G9A89_009092 [Geosiphon pyriformis]|nr:hypothetical protein G9A89_009092 [Geosiphon pyriformis]
MEKQTETTNHFSVEIPLDFQEIQYTIDSFRNTKPYSFKLRDDFYQQLVAERVEAGGDGSSLALQTLQDPRKYFSDFKNSKERCSKLRFNHIELETRDRFVKVILDGQPQKVDYGGDQIMDLQLKSQTVMVEQKDIVELEQYDALKKKNWKEMKIHFQNIENEIEAVANAFSNEYEKLSIDIEEAAKLLNETEQIERELENINTAISKQSKITVSEAQRILENQTDQLQQINKAIRDCNREISDLNCQYEALETEAAELAMLQNSEEKRASDAAKKAEMKDVQLEEMYNWYVASMGIYRKLLDIH